MVIRKAARLLAACSLVLSGAAAVFPALAIELPGPSAPQPILGLSGTPPAALNSFEDVPERTTPNALPPTPTAALIPTPAPTPLTVPAFRPPQASAEMDAVVKEQVATYNLPRWFY